LTAAAAAAADDDDDDDDMPIFRPAPTNITVSPGDRASLKCRVDNLGTKTVQTTNCMVTFLNYISHGSVGAHLRCVGSFSNRVVANCI